MNRIIEETDEKSRLTIRTVSVPKMPEATPTLDEVNQRIATGLSNVAAITERICLLLGKMHSGSRS